MISWTPIPNFSLAFSISFDVSVDRPGHARPSFSVDSLDLAALDDGAERVAEFLEHGVRDLGAGEAGNVPVPDGVARQHDLVSQVRPGPRGRADADVRHVAGQNRLLSAGAQTGQVVVEVGAAKRRDQFLLNHFFVAPRSDLVKLLRQRRARREHGRALGGLVDDVNDILPVAAGPVRLQQRGDRLAGLGHADRLQVAGGVPVRRPSNCIGEKKRKEVSSKLGGDSKIRKLAYSFCASIIINVLSFGDAVNVGAPSISRKDLTWVAEAMSAGFY